MVDNTRLVLLIFVIAFAILFWIAEAGRRRWKEAARIANKHYQDEDARADKLATRLDTVTTSRDMWRTRAIGVQAEKLEEWEKNR